MIISKNWLADYVDLPQSVDELTHRLTVSGLNLEEFHEVESGDVAIDLEVTSNRPDCLGHIGVAREVAVLYGKELKTGEPVTSVTGADIATKFAVEITCPQLCLRYTARIIRGVTIGPSPQWMQDRLKAIGCGVVNNVVDITNYVMLECGQPLHAFDLAKLTGGKIIVREANEGEAFIAIDHKTYKLSKGTCVIADAKRAVALGGVMGGADTEVADDTLDVLIEAADFDPLSIRTTARALHLHSPSSYRFERGVDPQGIDWASRRCCELILELAGGTLLDGVATAGELPPPPSEVKLRWPQIKRILGIDVPQDEVRRILTELGCTETHTCDHCVKVIPPTWRADLTREADLIEEVARIHGYDQIPEDVGVRMVPSHRTREDEVVGRVRRLVAAAGYDEALTLSAVEPSWVECFRPWSLAKPLATSMPVLRRATCLRQSLVPSLLACRRANETASNTRIELFEIAKIYLPQTDGLPEEKRVLAITSGGDFLDVKGAIEAIVDALMPGTPLAAKPCDLPLLDSARSAELFLGETRLGVLGQLSPKGLKEFELRDKTTIAEIDLGPLVAGARLIPTAAPLSNLQPMARDLNVVVDEKIRWSQVETIARDGAGELLESLSFGEEYRDANRLGAGKKSLLFSFVLRPKDENLTSDAADVVTKRIVDGLAKELGGELRS